MANPAANTNNRDRLTVNDNNAGFVRNLNYDYLDAAGDLDILANAADAGLAGGNNASMPVNVRTMETLIFNSAERMTSSGSRGPTATTISPWPCCRRCSLAWPSGQRSADCRPQFRRWYS